MKFATEFRDPELAGKLVARIRQSSTRPATLMEFCGGHTVAIFKYGLRQLLPETITMLAGPGCPVCVTSSHDLDRALALAQLPDTIITTFGDLFKVPGSARSLAVAKAEGSAIRVVYSAEDSLNIARANPGKSVIFIGIGFETTAPTIASSILEAQEQKLTNYYVLSLNKLCPPIIKTLLERGELKLNGIIAPGHVSAIIGSHPYTFIPEDFGVACAISGFEPLDILLAIYRLVNQIQTEDYRVEIAYRRGVKPEGNTQAQKLLDEVFEVSESRWRGIGAVPASGLKIKNKYRRYDAEESFSITTRPSEEPKDCICGDILRGVSTPLDCRLYRLKCTPEHPVGPCMVSSEGTCATYYHYGDGNEG